MLPPTKKENALLTETVEDKEPYWLNMPCIYTKVSVDGYSDGKKI
jgi:hypothetical protein